MKLKTEQTIGRIEAKVDALDRKGEDRAKVQEETRKRVAVIEERVIGIKERVDRHENLIWKIIAALGVLLAGTAGGADLIGKLF